MGAGRYIQEYGAIDMLGEEAERLSASHALVIGGKTALSLTKEKIEASLNKKGIATEYYVYTGFCNKAKNEAVANSIPNGAGYVIIGVGGGNVMDVAKHVAVLAGLPVINIPTSSATCAAYTPLSVCYTDDGRTEGTVHHKIEVNCVLADMDVLSSQPPRLMLSGIYDAIAKQYELYQRMLGVDLNECDIGLVSSYHTSGFIFDFLTKNTDAALSDLKSGARTKTLYDVIFVSIALTAVVSGLARGSNQTAIAHKVYECLRKLYPDTVRPCLHGELVALGLIVQKAYNGESDVNEFKERLAHHSIPATLAALSLDSDEAARSLYGMILKSSAMAGTNEEEQKRLEKSLFLIK